ncbi:TPA: ead/Ea22-like family protein [Escherichia coli]|nr:ead/Ea22-like family protein [Escherichia coli]
MSNIDKQALRVAAEKATPGDWRRASTRFNGITSQAVYPLCGKEEILANTAEKRDAEFIAAANPATVLALLDELEAKDKSINFLKDQLAQLANFNPDWDKLEAATDSLREHMAELTAARKRIAELEASHSNLREAMAGIHNTITGGGAYTPLAAILNASKRAYDESAAAAGRINGEG